MGLSSYKMWGAVVLVAGLSLWLLSGCWWSEEQVDYETAVVTRGDVVEQVRVTGQVRASAQYRLRFKEGGVLTSIPVAVGDTVEEGAFLGQVDPKDAQLAVEEARTRVAQAEAQWRRAQTGATPEALRVVEEIVAGAVKEREVLQGQIITARERRDAAMLQAEQRLRMKKTELSSLEAELKTAEAQWTEEMALANLRVEQVNKAAVDAGVRLDTDGEQIALQRTQAEELAVLRIRGTIAPLGAAIDMVDVLLGYTDSSTDDALAPVFSVLQPQHLTDGRLYFMSARSAYGQLLAAVQGTNVQLQEQAYDRVVQEVQRMLATMNDALEASITNNVITSTVLQDYKAQIALHRQTVDRDSLEVRQRVQAYKDAELQGVGRDAIKTEEYNQREADIRTAVQQRTQLQEQIRTQRTQLQHRIVAAREAVDGEVLSLGQVQVEWSTSIRELEERLEAAMQTIRLREAELREARTLPRQVDVAPFASEYAQAQVQLERAEQRVQDTIIRAPVAGVITALPFDSGETLTPSDVYVVMHGIGKEIRVDVAETDIGRVTVDASVIMTFDAFDYTEQFFGHVVAVDPAETVIDGVTYYRVTVLLNEDDERILSGMTATMEIIYGTAKDVLMIPALAVNFDRDRRYVEVVTPQGIEDRTVQLGLEGDVYYEVVSGLAEGEEVITYRP